jgi:hypothetical protein
MRLTRVVVCTAAACLVFGAATSVRSTRAAADRRPAADQQATIADTDSISLFSCHSLGGAQKVCFSEHGNVSQFTSPAGFEHIRRGYVGEGYALCNSSGINGWDAGNDEAGFGASTVSQPNGTNTLPLTITRNTTDGFFQLEQKFSRDTAEKDVTITMKLINVSRSSIDGVQLVRYFDGDIDNDNADDRYAQTTDSVWGWEDTEGHGLMLTALSFDIEHFMAAEPFSSWTPLNSGSATHCDIGGVTTPTNPGDFVGAVIYSLETIAAGKSKTVKVLYRRF